MNHAKVDIVLFLLLGVAYAMLMGHDQAMLTPTKVFVYWLIVFGVFVPNVSGEPYEWYQVVVHTLLAVVATLALKSVILRWLWPALLS